MCSKGQGRCIFLSKIAYCSDLYNTWLCTLNQTLGHLWHYGTAHVQVYKLTRVTRRALRNFVCNSHVGLVRHEYTARE